MEIIQQIGVDSTAIIQFCLFVISLIFLSQFVFGKYAEALLKRKENTKGGEDLALEIHNKKNNLIKEYEGKVRDQNAEIKELIDGAKKIAFNNYESQVSKVRKDVNSQLIENRSQIEQSLQVAKKEMKDQSHIIALSITNKMLGK